MKCSFSVTCAFCPILFFCDDYDEAYVNVKSSHFTDYSNRDECHDYDFTAPTILLDFEFDLLITMTSMTTKSASMVGIFAHLVAMCCTQSLRHVVVGKCVLIQRRGPN